MTDAEFFPEGQRETSLVEIGRDYLKGLMTEAVALER